MTAEQRTIPARDGFGLAATVFRPAGDDAGVAVGIHSATAVPRGFYDGFAQHLAAQGMTVVTYDYRGIGESAPASLRGFRATAADWVLNDMAGIVDFIQGSLRPKRIGHVGHSFGGQTPGLLPNGHLIDAMVTVVAQSGFWKLQRGWEKWNVGFHTHLTLPVLAQLMGYVPWSWFSRAEDLPKGVAQQWSSWCRTPGYLFDDASLPIHRYDEFQARILAYSVEDDHWGTVRAVDEVHAHYPNVTRKHLDPAADGLPSVGHFGYFSRRNEARWVEAVDWLRGTVAPSAVPRDLTRA